MRFLQRRAVTTFQDVGLIRLSTLPYRPDCVNYVLYFQSTPAGCHGFARRQRTAQLANFATLGKQCWSGSAVDRAVHTSSTQQARIRCIHNCVRFLLRDISQQ